MTKILSFQKERQKLINNWPEDRAIRKQQIKRLYGILCNECDAEVSQLKSFGFTDKQIYKMGLKLSSENIGRMVEEIENKNKE